MINAQMINLPAGRQAQRKQKSCGCLASAGLAPSAMRIVSREDGKRELGGAEGAKRSD
jgi:hypothetical protein